MPILIQRNVIDISDDSLYQDESSESIEPHNLHPKLADRKRQLGGRTLSSLSVPTAGSQDKDNFASVTIPVPNLKPRPKLNREQHHQLPLPREL